MQYRNIIAGPVGGLPIPTIARVAALDCLLDDIGTYLTPAEADMCIDYVAERLERDEVQGAMDTLRNTAGIDLTGVYRIIAIMHTEA